MKLYGNPRTGAVEKLASQDFRVPGPETILSLDGLDLSWVPAFGEHISSMFPTDWLLMLTHTLCLCPRIQLVMVPSGLCLMLLSLLSSHHYFRPLNWFFNSKSRERCWIGPVYIFKPGNMVA